MTSSKRFVVISGLPASGKTKVGRRLASALGARLIDKDAVVVSVKAALERRI